MPRQDVPEDADPVFKELMGHIRAGRNPDHKRLSKLDSAKRKAVEKAAREAMRKRKGAHRRDDGDVIDTGMFGG
jgi:hypothetical protein